MKLFTENVVVTANMFNVSLIQQIWLVNNEIVRRRSLSGRLFSALEWCNSRRRRLHLGDSQPDPNAIHPRVPGRSKARTGLGAPRTAHRIASSHTLQGDWLELHLALPANEGKDCCGGVAVRLFRPDAPAHNFSTVPMRSSATYYSKDELGFRLNLTIGPTVSSQAEGASDEVLQFAFNYHRDADNVADLLDAIAHWSDAKHHSMIVTGEMEASL